MFSLNRKYEYLLNELIYAVGGDLPSIYSSLQEFDNIVFLSPVCSREETEEIVSKACLLYRDCGVTLKV